LDELQGILIEEMEKVLFREKVFSHYSGKLKRILEKGGFFHKIPNVVFSDTVSYSYALEGFKGELALVEKPIVIIYEDIDRISDIAIIKKIFSISEQIVCDKIKVIFQYDQRNLDALGLERVFTEKYIPYIINVTQIAFEDMMAHLCQIHKIDSELLDAKELAGLVRGIGLSYLSNIDTGSVRIELKPTFANIAIRRAEQFLLELQNSLLENEEYRNGKNKKVVTSFYFIKHFCYTIYEKLHLGERLTDIFLFEHNGMYYTIFELFDLKDRYKETEGAEGLQEREIQAVLSSQVNAESGYALHLFDYNMYVKENISPFFDYESRVNEPIRNIVNKDANEKKDRLIWNLLCSGTTEYTDYEYAVKEMVDNVLSKPETEQQAAYENFLERMYVGNVQKSGNRTIYLMGFPHWLEMFRAFNVTSDNASDWCNLLAFYFRDEKVSQIDSELIETLNYCSLSSKKVFFNILAKFNSLEVIGNMNHHKSYREFLLNYIGALSRLGFTHTYSLDIIRNDKSGERVQEMYQFVLREFQKQIESLEPIGIASVMADVDTIKAFISKNIIIVNHADSIKFRKPRIDVDYRSSQSEEFKRLVALPREETESFEQEIEKSYEEGKITANEILRIIGSKP
jgi:hypothetical protein